MKWGTDRGQSGVKEEVGVVRSGCAREGQGEVRGATLTPNSDLDILIKLVTLNCSAMGSR